MFQFSPQFYEIKKNDVKKNKLFEKTFKNDFQTKTDSCKELEMFLGRRK